jgi:hypothetical protein
MSSRVYHASLCPWLTAAVVLGLGLAFPVVRGEPSPDAVQAFLKRNCVDCHDDDTTKGDLDLTALPFDLSNREAFRRWAYVYDRVTAGEMPPRDEERPDAADQQVFLDALGSKLRSADAARIAAEGRLTARRLTPVEYERTLQDLLGVDLPLAELLPEDPRDAGFDTMAESQTISDFMLERYLAAADVALDAAFRKVEEPLRDDGRTFGWEQLRRREPVRPNYREPHARPAHQDVVVWPTGAAFHGRMPPTRVSESGWYRIELNVRAVNPPPNGRIWCSVRTGAFISTEPGVHWAGSFEATRESRTYVVETWIRAGHMIEARPLDSGVPRLPFRTAVSGDPISIEKGGTPGLAIQSLSMRRIDRGRDHAAMRSILFGGDAAVQQGDAAAVAAQVRAFASRAFRRPVTAAETSPYVELAQSALTPGADARGALRRAYRAILISPRLLYLEEKPGELDAHATASRLSYFLWSSMPDEQLRALADSGRLREPSVRRSQVERMLAHPSSRGLIENFLAQWLRLAEIDFTTPDAKLHPEFDETLKRSMVAETHAYFRAMIDENLSADHVVDSDFGILNERLARHYGIPWGGEVGFQRVAFRPEQHRGGLITQGSVLKVTANGTTTSPVLRGVWMLERIMGQRVPPLPPNTPAIEPDIRGARTIRELLDKHRSVKSCAACHVKIDPPGYALENYDVTGGWRDYYRVVQEPRGWKQGAAVDPSHQLPDGRAFADIAEFKGLLLSGRDALARNLAAKLATYATGADISFADRTELDEIVRTTRPGNHGVRSLIHAVVASPLFLNK